MLTALAVCDLLTMVSYIPFAVQFYCRYGVRPSPERNTLPWAYFCLFHANFSVTAHTTSIWIAVVLSAFRYSQVRGDGAAGSASTAAGAAESFCTTRIAIAGVFLASSVVLLPNYISLTVNRMRDEATNRSVYVVVATNDEPTTATTFDHVVNTINFWIHALVIKLAPCALMAVFGALLVWTLHRHYRAGTHLRNRCNAAANSVSAAAAMATASTAMVVVAKKEDRKQRRREQEHSRTTAMLIAVIVLFLLTEMPQGLLALCSGLQPAYFVSYYVPLGDVMDIVALVNNGINFFLYSTMSRQFRMTFYQLFLKKKSTPVANHAS